ncbi:MFS transporter [Gordonia amarae]|uniref:MFS transporter n=1 Tax=Gordonia amarae TaxID=36821 RepID=UPI001AFADA2A|nr:MFS transporter [Gordonia amarae]QHN31169.1 MFS transporter [Gordonia amarae]
MFTVVLRADDSRIARLTVPLYAHVAAKEFVLLYPVYALLFDEHGLSVTQIGSLFALWSGIGLVTGVPAGALADVVSRRYVLAAAPMLTAAGFTLWLLAPGYTSFAAGFVLWGISGSLTSGALEAFVHDELSHRGAVARYARAMGVTRAIEIGAAGAATLVAVPVLNWAGRGGTDGDFAAVGAASVATCVLCAIAAMALPENRGLIPATPDRKSADEDPSAGESSLGYLATLRAGIVEARDNRRVRVAIVLLVVLTSFWGVLDEYAPLLVADHGVATETIPLVLAVIWAGATAGGLCGGALARWPDSGFAGLIAVGGVCLAAGAVLGGIGGWMLLAVAFGICQAADVVADTRLQDTITGQSRATVTSLGAFGADAAATAVYPAVAAVVSATSYSAAFTMFAAPYLVVACVLSATSARRRRYLA